MDVGETVATGYVLAGVVAAWAYAVALRARRARGIVDHPGRIKQAVAVAMWVPLWFPLLAFGALDWVARRERAGR